MKEAIFLALFLIGQQGQNLDVLNQGGKAKQGAESTEDLERVLFREIYSKNFKVDVFNYGTKRDSLLINFGKGLEYELDFIVFQDYSDKWYFDWIVNEKKHRVFDFSYDEMKKAAKLEYVYPGGAGIKYHLHEYKRRDRFEIKKEVEEGPFILEAKYSILFIYNVKGWDKTSGNLTIKLYNRGYIPDSREFFPDY